MKSCYQPKWFDKWPSSQKGSKECALPYPPPPPYKFAPPPLPSINAGSSHGQAAEEVSNTSKLIVLFA